MFSFYLTGFKKLLNLGKKIFLVLMVYLVVISLFFHFITQDKPKITYDPVKKNREKIYKTINDSQLNKTEEGKLAIAVYRLILCGIIGEACTNNPADGDKNFSHSLFGFMSNLIVLPYANPPASGVYWAYSGLQNAGFAPKTYAAEGIGFTAIKPLMSIWKVFRDLSYMLLVLVLIAIGFMIMFRSKINPQTVISVENSLPKIIIALLLITFSFPIAGFLIDLMYIFIIIIVGILGQLNPNISIGELQKEYLVASPTFLLDKLIFLGNKSLSESSPIIKVLNLLTFGISGYAIESLYLMYSIGSSILNLLPSLIKTLIMLFNFFISMYYASKISGFFTRFLDIFKNISVATFSPGHLIPAIAYNILFIIILIILLIIALPLIIGFTIFLSLIFLFFRIFFILLTTYLKIIFYILLSPLYLLLEAIPGKSSFSTWLRTLFAEISTFPLIVAIILMGNLIVTNTQISLGYKTTNQQWKPPFLSGINPDAWIFLIGYGLVLLIPEIIQLWKSSLGVKESPLKLGLGTFITGAAAGWGAARGGLGGFYTSLSQMPLIGSYITQKIRKTGLGKKIAPLTEREILAEIAKQMGVKWE